MSSFVVYNMIAKVIVDISASQVDKIFDYLCNDDVVVGSRVLVPFGPRTMQGIVIDLSNESSYDESKIKSIIKTIDIPVTKSCVLLAQWMRDRFHTGLSDALRLFIPNEVRKQKTKEQFDSFLELKDEEKANTFLSGLKKNATKMKTGVCHILESKREKSSTFSQNFGSNVTKRLIDENIVIVTKESKTRTPYTSANDKIEKPKLTTLQQNIVKQVEGKSGTFLLHGVTGSGKTEVYLNLMEHALCENRTGILLVPEISLTPQMLTVFRSRFSNQVAILHSGLSVGEKYDEWMRIQNGDAKIVIGARSAIFAPLKNIGIIIIDEEHEQSYISETNPRYSAIKVAEKRSDLENCTLVLGSATPSIESYHNAITGKYTLLEMNERINKKPLPPIEIVDMSAEFKSGNQSCLSNVLKDAIAQGLKEGKQSIVFINRRGFVSYVMCKECGWVAKCPSCDVSLVYHKAENALKCHYCGNKFKMFDECPVCHSKNLSHGATGTQKVSQEIADAFPDAKILRMDNDTTRTKDAHLNILTKFKNHEADILVGTQMIAKGHDFPLVTTVGIIDADVSLHQSSYCSCERTFQLITQVAGRAGRGVNEGRVLLQTHSPRHFVYKMAKSYDYIGFYKKEINLREVTKYPPFAKILRIMFKSSIEEVVKNTTKEYYDRVKEIQAEHSADFYHLGVMRSPISKIQDQYRYQILIRLRNGSDAEQKLYDCLNIKRPKNCYVFIEENPNSLS